jgi:hypothetical protein
MATHITTTKKDIYHFLNASLTLGAVLVIALMTGSIFLLRLIGVK